VNKLLFECGNEVVGAYLLVLKSSQQASLTNKCSRVLNDQVKITIRETKYQEVTI